MTFLAEFPMHRIGVALVFVMTFTLCGAAAFAGEGAHVEVSDEIAALNEAGVSASLAGDYETAVARFKESLAIQELNITYVNLGRALAALGDCEGARAAYDRTASAPTVDSPTPEEVLAVVYKYRVDLETSCTPDAEQAVGAEKHVAPIEQPSEVPPSDTGTSTASWSPWSWVALSAGGALLLTGVVIDTALLSSDFDALDKADTQEKFDDLEASIETKQAVNVALFATGGLLAATGAVLLILDATADSAPSGQALAAPWLTAESAGIGVAVRW